MRYVSVITAAILACVVFLGGCGDRQMSMVPPSPDGETGGVSFSVNWSEQTTSRAIPPEVTSIIVTVIQGGIAVGNVTITRPASTGHIGGIPVGTAIVSTQAKDSANVTLATGGMTVTVVRDQYVAAHIIMTVINGSPIAETTNAIDGAEMVWVPAGEFLRGSPEGVGPDDEQPQRSIYLDGYWMYKYEVTVAQYRAFCVATGRAMPEWPGDQYSWAGKSGWDDPEMQQHPIVFVTWYDAIAYADWAGVSLPTEAQWEKAARGVNGRNYPWGGLATAGDLHNGWNWTRCVNYYNSYSQGISTWPVGSFASGASPYGVHDMAGSVWEWCADRYGSQYYSVAPMSNPSGPPAGTGRVLRGGSWCRGEVDSHCALRFEINPSDWNLDLGFRCVSVSPGP